MEPTKGLGYRDIKGVTKDCFIFDIWFASKRWDEYVMDVGAEIIGMFKINRKLLRKYNIENMTKDFIEEFLTSC